MTNRNAKKTKKQRKGIVQQIHTGEGKSVTIQIISAVLAKMGKTIHIATSNIFLANRDYHDSYEFFQTIGIQSAVLLHKEELPTQFAEESESESKGNDESNFRYKKERFPDTYFGEELFDNSANMNIGVCGIGNIKRKAKVIFSTFINFEALFLRMMENYPDIVNDYFNSCSLLIDEADSILIDELSNGTILSRPMNTNGKEILIYVYHCQMQKRSPKDVVSDIKKIWPRCTDISERDIITMYKEIKLVNSTKDGFTKGKKYSIETMEIDRSEDEKILENVLKKLSKVKKKMENIRDQIYNIPIAAIETVIEKSLGKKQTTTNNNNNNQTTNNNNNNQTTNNNNNQTATPENKVPFTYGNSHLDEKPKKIQVKYIVPYDYDHKGNLEPNKEFNGYIQQFIAIKEMFAHPEENKNMFIKDVSMSYLYVSHPTFVRLYNAVCGFTGTIGEEYEKDIFSKHYNLDTLKIPRRHPRRCVDIPISLVRNFKERNKKIVEEIAKFNQKGNPVLAIFQDLNEISLVYKMLKNIGINDVYIFDGRDQSIKPDFIAGRKGAVSLGSNICGRGADIKNPEMPLHVIISFYTSNSRVMQQALGRTGRKGQKGSTHIICPYKQYIKPIKIIKNSDLNNALKEFDIKNQLQIEFIDSFKKKRSWIFTPLVDSPDLDIKTIKVLRESQINVNRIIASKYRFPLCLKIDTFLEIQAQRIISLYNCPNCRFTWILFQRYVREMIFEPWSLLIDKADRKFMDKEYEMEVKNNYLKKKSKKLHSKLCNYLPPDDKNTGMIETFMWIFNIVNKKWETKIYNIFSNYSFMKLKQAMPDKFLSFNVGFKPYNLMDCSGARISDVNDEDRVPSFIIDPELIYIRKTKETGHPIRFSITEAIDKIFNRICSEINKVIGTFIGLKFFLRHTLAGCEFGICFDFNLENVDEKL